MKSILESLRDNPYPGRLIMLARTMNGELTGGYALTGRSPSSRARRLETTGADEVTVVPVGLQDNDALRHYPAAMGDERWTVYGNGWQVAEVAGRLARGSTPGDAFEGLDYEPDPPIFTPRITAVVDRAGGRAWFGAARRPEHGRAGTDITVTALGEPTAGQAVLLTTYRSDGRQVSIARRHFDASIAARDMDELLAEFWAALDPRFLVAATVFAALTGVHGPTRHA